MKNEWWASKAQELYNKQQIELVESILETDLHGLRAV